MAKGDTRNARAQIQTSRQTYEPQLQQYTNSLYPQQQQNWNNFNAAAAQGQQDYGNLMTGYGGMFTNPGISYNRSPEMQSAMGGYEDFARTGGFSPQDLQDIRARGVSPIRAAYSNAIDEVNRQRNLSGGYSPNYDAAMAKMARDQAYSMADANQNVNATIAQMVQQGKLAGNQGLGGLAAEDSQLGLGAQEAAAQARLGALSGGGSLYSATPGMARMFGDQVSQSNTDLARSLGLSTGYDQSLLGDQNQLANSPGIFSTATQDLFGNKGIIPGVGGLFMGKSGN